jgi:hypothetical protein
MCHIVSHSETEQNYEPLLPVRLRLFRYWVLLGYDLPTIQPRHPSSGAQKLFSAVIYNCHQIEVTSLSEWLPDIVRLHWTPDIASLTAMAPNPSFYPDLRRQPRPHALASSGRLRCMSMCFTRYLSSADLIIQNIWDTSAFHH